MNMRLKFFTFCFSALVFLVSGHLIASDSTNISKNRYKKSIRLFYQAGQVLQTNEFVKGQNASNQVIDYFQSLSLQYGIETDGHKIWQQIYGYPRWGFGFYAVNFFNKDELGTPSAVYGFFDAPFIRFKRWSINYEVGFGLTYDWNPYDQVANPYQYAIGSYKTVFIDAGLNADIMLGKRFNLTAGFTFTHFSNGATRVPNYGINLMAPRIALKYIFGERPEFIKTEIPEYDGEWEFVALIALASKQLAYDTTQVEDNPGHHAETYGIFTFSTGINRQISRKVKFGLGADIGYDGSWNSYINYRNGEISRMDAGNGNKINIGLYGAFELVVHKLSVVVQPGWYVFRADWQVPDNAEGSPSIAARRKSEGSYQRLGIKYHVNNNLFFGINIRAYDFGIADYIEWNMGYRVKWR
ncbi:MAG: acyloxyacyl hydrolase [Chlorobi bacterium]|nr:acyloxyacyl hydrolase [Chlorobiota bacterium]